LRAQCRRLLFIIAEKFMPESRVRCGGVWETPFADGNGAVPLPEPMTMQQELAWRKRQVEYSRARLDAEQSKSLMTKIGDSMFRWLRKQVI
jgi:hypothetical protein